jgi:hypothetical protein
MSKPTGKPAVNHRQDAGATQGCRPADFWEAIRHYKPVDFMCNCGECHKPTVAPSVVRALDDVREAVGLPLPVQKGARCQAANGRSKGAPNSPHVPNGDGLAWAVDVMCNGADLRAKVLDAARAQGFNWIGLGRNWVHLEIRADKEPRLWVVR